MEGGVEGGDEGALWWGWGREGGEGEVGSQVKIQVNFPSRLNGKEGGKGGGTSLQSGRKRNR